MPLLIPNTLPAIELLREENILVELISPAVAQNIRPIKIAILNLMPIKITTETDFVRLLSASPLPLEITFLKVRSHVSKNTSTEHLDKFYTYFDEIKHKTFDGLIITGAPIEDLEFEAVDYWSEMEQLFAWARTNVAATLNICWAAQASLYYNYGIKKYPLKEKKFGIFEQQILAPHMPIFRGFDSIYHMPVSRHTEIKRKDIEENPELSLISTSTEGDVSIVMAREGREFFVTGHMEYAPNTLHNEYQRDFGKRNDVPVPMNYYALNNPNNPPIITWRAHANLFFANWINHYVCGIKAQHS